jgi:peptidoglycan L-alanyl-D-glutamate endopeptidase CwlK
MGVTMDRPYFFSARSFENLRGVRPDLVACVVLCLYRYATTDFVVIDGVRTIDQQRIYVAEGSSGTMDSKHLVQPDGWGHAVDLAPLIQGEIPWENWQAFHDLYVAMTYAAKQLRIIIEWGGAWKGKMAHDGPHFQLPD